jgi:hypothetical protein
MEFEVILKLTEINFSVRISTKNTYWEAALKVSVIIELYPHLSASRVLVHLVSI